MTIARQGATLCGMQRLVYGLALIGMLCIAGCSNKPILRDFYFGKAWLQPDQMDGPQPRDADGNPVLDRPTPRADSKETTS